MLEQVKSVLLEPGGIEADEFTVAHIGMLTNSGLGVVGNHQRIIVPLR